MNPLRIRHGRPLRLALLGGGPDSWIGRMHQSAAELDGWWRVVGGVFSGDPIRSRAAGAALGFDPARCYGDLAGAAMVIDGRAEAFVETGVKIWDLAPIRLLVEEAGGAFTDLSGAKKISSGSAIATNGKLQAHVLDTIRRR